jgi:uncharacterized protein (TIGR02246 family)
MRTLSISACAALVALSLACTTAPPDTHDADIKAVKDTEAQWVKDANTKEVEKFAGHYTDDASVLLPGAPVINGKDAIRGALKPMLADPNFSLNFESQKADAAKSGDIVYTVGTYTMTESDPKDPKKTITDKGKYVTVFKKQADGSWKAVADMLNSSLPAGS